MFRALIWKDVRLNRLPLVFAAAMVVVSYLVVIVQFSIDPVVKAATWNRVLVTVIFAASVASHAVSQFSLSVLAGNLVASERVDRSAEFLAYTPASRGAILRAKAVLLAAVALGLMLLHLCGMLIPLVFSTDMPVPTAGTSTATIWVMFARITAYGFCGAGIGWMTSCILSSNSSAVLFAIVTPVLVPIATILSLQAINRQGSEQAVMVAAWCALGLAGFLWGTQHYLSRVET
jgi:ABC-type transport system involved in multi-copper enzyme maturation permease subunit